MATLLVPLSLGVICHTIVSNRTTCLSFKGAQLNVTIQSSYPHVCLLLPSLPQLLSLLHSHLSQTSRMMTEREPAKSLKECRHDRHQVSNLFSLGGKYSTRELLDRANKPHSLGKHGKFLEKRIREGMQFRKELVSFLSQHLTCISIWQLTPISQGLSGSILKNRIQVKASLKDD